MRIRDQEATWISCVPVLTTFVCWFIHSVIFYLLFFFCLVCMVLLIHLLIQLVSYLVRFIIHLLMLFVCWFVHWLIYYFCWFVQGFIHSFCLFLHSFLLLVCLFLHLFTESMPSHRAVWETFQAHQTYFLQYQFFTQGYAFLMNPVMHSTCWINGMPYFFSGIGIDKQPQADW